MDALAIQVRRLLAQGFNTAEIAESCGLELTAVRAAIGQLTKDDAADVIGVLYGMSQDRNVKPGDRIKAGIYVHEEIMGRNEKKANTPMTVISLVEFNERLAAARQRSLPAQAVTVTDVQPSTQSA